ncbi:MAG: hypothetical protein ACR2NJ_04735 [Acidimicrobiales bacterium]
MAAAAALLAAMGAHLARRQSVELSRLAASLRPLRSELEELRLAGTPVTECSVAAGSVAAGSVAGRPAPE